LAARAAYLVARRTAATLTIERRLGVETARELGLAELGLDARERCRYEPSAWHALRRILAPEEIGADDVFLDVGAGKGRVLLQALRYPFKRVIGVELSPQLAAIALGNLARCSDPVMAGAHEVITADATRFPIPDEVTVIYMFNPLRGAAFRELLARIGESVERRPRPLRLIYNTPLEEAALLESGLFLPLRAVRGRRPGRAWAEKTAIRMYVLRAELCGGDSEHGATR